MPLALPLTVLVYLAAFVPVVGAFVSGLLAVLVAFAERGPVIALAVLGVVLAVQQLEGNVLQPLVMGRVIRLSAFVVLIAVTIGATWLGIFGAFLATPVAASIARILEYLNERREPEIRVSRLIASVPQRRTARSRSRASCGDRRASDRRAADAEWHRPTLCGAVPSCCLPPAPI